MVDLKSMPWLMPPYEKLLKVYRQDKLPHALLLMGEKGCGASQLAHLLATALLCQSHKDIPCGHCQSCALLNHQTHPDLSVLSATQGKTIGVDEVRDLIQSCAHTATLGGLKLVVIDPADQMNQTSANALLKLLEEPPGNVVFLLVSTQMSRLLPTILSRVQRIFVPSPDQQPSLSTESRTFQSTLMDVILGKKVPTALSQSIEEGLLTDAFSLVIDVVVFWAKQFQGIEAASDYSSLALSSSLSMPLRLRLFALYRQALQLHQQMQYYQGINKTLLLDSYMIDCRAFYREARAC